MHVFTYGSLMFPDVWSRVVTGAYHCAEATAEGYARFVITAATYPGAVPTDGATLQGIVYFDVEPHDLTALDIFEGDHYRRETIKVMVADGRELEAETYVWLHTDKLEALTWEPEAFALQRFIDTYCDEKIE